MVLFRWGHRKIKNFGPVKSCYCNNCRYESQWELMEISFWFTLFLIPILPYESQTIIVCPMCNCGIELNTKEFEGYRIRTETGESDQGNIGAVEAMKNETQINYLREIAAYHQEKIRDQEKKSVNN